MNNLLIFAVFYVFFTPNYCQDFCAENNENNLIDSVFSLRDCIYTLRGSKVWLFKQNDEGIWSQSGQPIELSDFFVGRSISKFDSGFAINDYEKCQFSDPSCADPNFDPTNVTFIFVDNSFYIFRSVEEFRFEAVNHTDPHIPWNANHITSIHDTDITDIEQYFDLKPKVEAAVFSNIQQGSDLGANLRTSIGPRIAILYANSKISHIEVNLTVKYFQYNISESKPAKGAFQANDKLLFILENHIYEYTLQGKFEPQNQNVRQFFCPSAEDQITSNQSDESESTVTNSQSISDGNSEDTTITDNNNSNGKTDSNSNDIKPSNSNRLNRLRRLRWHLLVLFALICFTCITITILASIGFTTFSVKDKRMGSETTITSLKSEKSESVTDPKDDDQKTDKKNN